MICKTLIFTFVSAVALEAAPVYIGTNTGGNSLSKGIYLADFDSETGKLSDPELVAEYKNPGFLAQHPSKPIIYACGQPNQPFPDESSSVAAFAISDERSLKFLGEASAGGKGACHVAVDATGRTVAVANYGDGSFSTIRLSADGVPGEIGTLVKSKGSGPNTQRQNGPHPHGVYFDKSNKFFFMPDLGLDQVVVHAFNAADSTLGTALEPLKTSPGAGPRHMAFSPNEKHAYVINELDNTVLAATYDTGKFTVLGATKTLPQDFPGGNTTAEVEVHPTGKFVYTSNRGHNSIAVYRRDETTGSLSFLQHADCGGKTPRHFKIDPTGKWLLCGNQDSHTITVMKLDQETGLLSPPMSTVPTPSPICLLFTK